MKYITQMSSVKKKTNFFQLIKFPIQNIRTEISFIPTVQNSNFKDRNRS